METITIQKNKLPEGWEEDTLVNLSIDIHPGSTPQQSENAFVDDGVLFIRSENITNNGIKITNGQKYVKKEIYGKYKKNKISEGDILYNIIGASIGRVDIVENEIGLINQNICKIKPKIDKILPKYLLYFLRAKYNIDEISLIQKGGAQPALSASLVKDFMIVYPKDMEVQHQIVQKFDAFFESYNKLKQEKQKAKEKYKQILQSALVSLIEAKKLSKGWEEKSIGELFDQNTILEIKSGFPCGKHNKSGEGIIHIRPMNINTDGQIDLLNCKYVEYNKEYEDYLLKEGDVIFNNTNSRELVGKTACFKINENCLFSNHMTRIRVDRNKILPEFLSMYLHNLWKIGLFNRICHSHVSQASVNTNKLKEVKIVLPTIEDQKRIVHIIENIVKKFKLMNTEQKNIDFQLSQLPKAVLSKAFKGELI